MTRQEIREAREFAQYLKQLATDLDEAGRSSTGEDVHRSAEMIERLAHQLIRTRNTVASVRTALKEHAA